MGRRIGLEGSVRQHPPGSGRWRGRLPSRLDPHRRYIDGIYPTERECRKALNEAIVDLEAGRAPRKSEAPTGGPVRRVRNIVEDYIEARRNDAYDPIAINTVRDYNDVLKNVINRSYADLGGVPANQLDSLAIDTWFRRPGGPRLGGSRRAPVDESRARSPASEH